jgi:ABC-type transporter Mla subunit MlaD
MDHPMAAQAEQIKAALATANGMLSRAANLPSEVKPPVLKEALADLQRWASSLPSRLEELERRAGGL